MAGKLRAIKGGAAATSRKTSLPEEEAERVRNALWKIYRERYGENKAELAKALGLSSPSVYNLLTGVNRASIPTVERLAKLLGVEPEELRKGAKPRASSSDALAVAIAYWPDRWGPEDVAQAREYASSGEKHTAQGWTLRLDEIRERRTNAERKN